MTQTTAYLSAKLELTSSVVPEVEKLTLTPLFDKDHIEFTISEDGDPFVSLNVRQIECLVDFLTAWLARRPKREAAATA